MYSSHWFFCLNRRADDAPEGCCASRGSEHLWQQTKVLVQAYGIKGIRINKAGCLGCCAKGPVIVIYPQQVWLYQPGIADIEQVIRWLIGEQVSLPACARINESE